MQMFQWLTKIGMHCFQYICYLVRNALQRCSRNVCGRSATTHSYNHCSRMRIPMGCAKTCKCGDHCDSVRIWDACGKCLHIDSALNDAEAVA